MEEDLGCLHGIEKQECDLGRDAMPLQERSSCLKDPKLSTDFLQTRHL